MQWNVYTPTEQETQTERKRKRARERDTHTHKYGDDIPLPGQGVGGKEELSHVELLSCADLSFSLSLTHTHHR